METNNTKNSASKTTKKKSNKLLIALIAFGSMALLGASAGIAAAVADRQSATTSVQVPNPVQGPAGTPGAQGETGPQGPKGRDGKDGKNADEKLIKALTGQVKELIIANDALKAKVKTLDKTQKELGEIVVFRKAEKTDLEQVFKNVKSLNDNVSALISFTKKVKIDSKKDTVLNFKILEGRIKLNYQDILKIKTDLKEQIEELKTNFSADQKAQLKETEVQTKSVDLATIEKTLANLTSNLKKLNTFVKKEHAGWFSDADTGLDL